jgi:disulfide bond formation protein DsbB
MRFPSLPTIALAGSILAALALAIAHASEQWEGLVPCALCLLQRWPYRAVIVLGLLAAVVPRRFGRWLVWVMVIALIGDAAIAAVHVGVEAHWWPSPLPECAAPRFTGGTIAERLAAMPARPTKPCDEPAYLIPGLPISMAAMNLMFAVAFAAALAFGAWRSR